MVLSLIPAVLFTSFWFLTSFVPYCGDFVNPAYGLVNLQPVIGFAAFFGLSGVVFVMAYAGVALFLAFEPQVHPQKRKNSIVTVVALCLLAAAILMSTANSVASGGYFFMQKSTEDESQQARALCQINGGVDRVTSLTQHYDLVFWSELSAGDMTKQKFDTLSAWTKTTGSIVGAAYWNDPYNMAALVSDGKVQYQYKKTHPVPFAEPGTTPGPGIIYSARTKLGSIAMAICFDLNFPFFIWSALPRSTDILVQPSATWGPIGMYHYRVNAVRAIEQGVLLVRCSSQGFSGVFFPDGRISAFVGTNQDGDYEFTIPNNFRRRTTVYSYIGDAFAFVVCAFALLIWIAAVLPTSVLLRIGGRFHSLHSDDYHDESGEFNEFAKLVQANVHTPLN